MLASPSRSSRTGLELECSIAARISPRTENKSARIRSPISLEILVSGSYFSAQPITASKIGSRSFPLSVSSYMTRRPLAGSFLSADNLLRFEPAQPVGQDVGRNALAGIQKVLKSCGAAKHHVADYRQRPAVSEYTHPVPNGTLVGLVNLAPSITALEFPCK